MGKKLSMKVCKLDKTSICELLDNTPLRARNINEHFAINEVTILSFDLPVVPKGKWRKLSNETLIFFNNEYYNVKTAQFVHSKDGKLMLHIEAKHLSEILASQLISVEETTPRNIVDLLKIALLYDENGVSQSGWTIGDIKVDKVKLRGLEANEQSPFSIILSIVEKYDGIAIFDSKTMKVNVIPSKSIDYPALDLRVSKNLKEVDITYDTSELCTRLYGYGGQDKDGNDLDIMSVNPTGLPYVDNFDYYVGKGYPLDYIRKNPQMFVRTNIYREESIYDPQDLYDNTVRELKKVSQPKVDVKIQALNTRKIRANNIVNTELGDCVLVHDEDLNMSFVCNVIKKDIDYENPHLLNVELVNSIQYRDIIAELFNSVNNVSSIVHSGGITGGVSMEEVKDYLNLHYLSVEQLEAKYIDADTIRANYLTAEQIKATYIDAESIAAKYATIANLEVVEAKIKNLDVDKINAEFANINKLLVDYGEFHKLVATDAEIEELKAGNITVAGKIKADKAELEELIATKVTVGDFNAYKATIEKLFALYATIEHLEANYIKAQQIEATYAKIKELDVVKGNFETLRASLAEVEKLVANKADINDLNVINATIETLKADLIKVNELVAKKVDAQYVQAEIVKANQVITDDLKAIHAIVDVLETKYATIEALNAEVANINTLIANKADIEDLNTANATIGKLEALLANIETILAGSIGTGSLQAIHITAKNAVFDKAVIKSGYLDTIDTKVVNIATSDGGLKIVGNTQQWFDKTGKIRMQAGQDEQGNFSFAVFGSDGTTKVFDQNGITEYAVPNGIIRDDMVADDANIQAKKVQYLNKDGNTTLQTHLEVEQGRIDGLIKETTIDNGDGTTTTLKDKYTELSATVDGFSGTIADVETKVDEATGKVTAMESKVTKIEADTNGLKTEVSKVSGTAESAKTLAQQAADKFTWIVKSGTDETNFELTDRTATLVAQDINLKGLVTFSGLNSDVKNKITNAESNASDAKNKIDNLNVGGRNYLVNSSKFTKEQPFTGVSKQQSQWWYEFGDGIFIYTKESFKAGDVITIQCESNLPWTDVYDMDDPKNIQKAGFGLCIGTKENIQTAGPTRVEFIAGDGVSKKLVKTYTLPSVIGVQDLYLGFRFTIYSNHIEDTNGSFWNLKVELGNKATDWTPAPEDKANQQIIDDWTNPEIQDGVTAINGGNIQTGSIKAQQIDVDDLTVDGGALMNKVNAQEIDTDRLTGKAIHANLLSLYDMRVLNKDTNKETLVIDNVGNVTLRGTLESFDYSSGKSGWALNANGNMELNDLTARGSIINNMGGIASSGNGNPNLIKTSKLNEVWGYAGGYKFDVTSVDDNEAGNGQHYNFKCTTVGSSAGFYLNLFTEEQGMVIGKTYTWSFWAKSSVEKTGRVGHESGGTATITIPTDWKYYSYTWEALETTNKSFIFYIGQQLNEIVSIRDFKIEEGSNATSWTIPSSDGFKKVIFWAGSSYDERDTAPFRVYSDGSTVSNKGEYSGLWTGDIRVGNISIIDSSESSGNDANLTIRNGQDGIKKVQLSDSNSSMFAQDLIISSNAYSPTITLKQNGGGVFTNDIVYGKSIIGNGVISLNGQQIKGNKSSIELSTNIEIGNPNLASDLTVYGNIYAKDSLTVMNQLLFGNIVKCTIHTNGLDFDFM